MNIPKAPCRNCSRRKSSSSNNFRTKKDITPTSMQENNVEYIRPMNKTLSDYNTPEINYQKQYLKTNMGKVSVAKFQTELDSWIGGGYEHLGEIKTGTDCIGLVLGVYKALGLIPADIRTGEYSKDWYLQNDIQTHPAFDQIKKTVNIIKIQKQEDFLPGDIVVFQFGRAVEAHVALYSIKKSFIHAVAGTVGKGSVIESRGDDFTWTKRISYAYRLTEGNI